MSSRRNSRVINLPAPYLRRVWLDASRVTEPESYPFCLPLFSKGDFDLVFDRAVTIVVGENGTGKSTLLEGIAALAGYDEAGGGKGYRSVDHSGAIELMGGRLSTRCARAGCRRSPMAGSSAPKASSRSRAISTRRPVDDPSGPPPPDFLSHSHGEGFLRFFDERCRRQGIFIFDEPESALSPSRQIDFLKLLRRMDAVRHLPGHHGDPCADPDGLSERSPAAGDQIRPRACHAWSRPSISV